MLVVGITLVFLTVQIRQGTRATRSAAAIESSAMVAASRSSLRNSRSTSTRSWLRTAESPKASSGTYPDKLRRIESNPMTIALRPDTA